MRQFGKVDIPQEAFIAALKMDDLSACGHRLYDGQPSRRR